MFICFAFCLSLARQIVCAFDTQACIVFIAQFSVKKEENTIIAVFPIEFDMDLSIVTNNVFVNSTNIYGRTNINVFIRMLISKYK